MEPVSNTPSDSATDQPAFALGIDVSKDHLEVALLTPGGRLHTKSVRNAAVGFKALLAWINRLTSNQELHACLEATGGFEEAAALALDEAGHRVSVVNPRRIKAYAGAQLQRNKTDRADAALIARFCQRERPMSWQPPSAEQRRLRELTRGLEALKQQRDQLRNRRDSGPPDGPVYASLTRVLETIELQITHLEDEIEGHLQATALLQQRHHLLCSIPGIGSTTASVVLAELGRVERFESARAVAAYAGLTPRNYRSGSSVVGRTRLSKVGNRRLRRALFFPALSALRHNAVIRQFGERLRGHGLAGKAVVGAAMRKLLHICYGVLRSGRAFDASLHLSA